MSKVAMLSPDDPLPLSSALCCLDDLPKEAEVTLTLELGSIYTLLMLLERVEFERRWNRGELRACAALSKAVQTAHASRNVREEAARATQ